MPTNMTRHEFFRREAERLRSMAGAPTFEDVKDELLAAAENFSAAAQRHEPTWQGVMGQRTSTR